jgi:hypothetical protein
MPEMVYEIRAVCMRNGPTMQIFGQFKSHEAAEEWIKANAGSLAGYSGWAIIPVKEGQQ